MEKANEHEGQTTVKGSRNNTDLKLKTCLPSPSFSYELLLGLAYCPAIRPMRTTGNRAPQIRTREKERMSPIFEEMFSYALGFRTFF